MREGVVGERDFLKGKSSKLCLGIFAKEASVNQRREKEG